MIARLQKSMKDKDQGFTLIELLVVIVIIGILAAIAIPLFLNQQKKGVDAGIKSDLKGAATVASTLVVDNASATIDKPALEAGGWKHTTSTDFTITGSPSSGNFCISGHNAGGSTTADTAEWKYDQANGGLQSSKAAKC
jgi:type IV pilus assembly protein PilA